MMKTYKAQIKDYVDDHYRYFDFYPYDVEVEDKIYSYQEYMTILDELEEEDDDNIWGHYRRYNRYQR